MKLYTAIFLLAAAVAYAQQQDSNQGPNLSEGSNAVSNPNENNGWQAQGSFFDGSQSGANNIGPHGSVKDSFNHQAENQAILDSNFVNPSKFDITGNKGDTANGQNNKLGDIFAAAGLPPPPAGPHPVVRRGSL
ncbi:hypothetical protein GGI11_006192 [Coemansia sp. RSA 2049]|nr:hypothetical protein GGI11_006192 [Coemansia sp. RSA 2049]KAJ2509631.1 hypothetical protein H4217_008253 [Coemansia sp. RSA 1939]KAJ2594287.1 hypothetical protein EV177_008415 [Coemansia sp. RSA 1804]KAJ2681599.1 hypothetical protein GGH99_005120 [Coemansia sp. RSA 1285]